jgi:AcrR family transcriptional regulator
MTTGPATQPVGRPRSGDRLRPGRTPREEILDAAAELFTSRGFAATSTRMIADAVGIRQASLYYHVSNKEELLAELLSATVLPSLEFAESLPAESAPDERLFALAAYDTRLLSGGRWNLGALYLLPEVRGDRFAVFRSARARLRSRYGELLTALGSPAELTDLVFGLVESVITVRSEHPIGDDESLAQLVASGCLRLAGVAEERIAVVAGGTLS